MLAKEANNLNIRLHKLQFFFLRYAEHPVYVKNTGKTGFADIYIYCAARTEIFKPIVVNNANSIKRIDCYLGFVRLH